ncbi:hypothetical protein GHT06_020408 [Daphnia sinensis]|uniref:FLYWCH-type domain-containing protein n=1 Tax=Daphnia sinensis TaxID=1820382 RepID=A0AAD5PPY2_9CRUS|nr:hypothetical protein GHT06_020408 [Daphnia sinensis]
MKHQWCYDPWINQTDNQFQKKMGFVCSLCRLTDSPFPLKIVSPASDNIEQSRPKRKIKKPTLFSPSPPRKRVNRIQHYKQRTIELPAPERVPNLAPQVTDAHHQKPSPTDFPSVGTLLDGSFGNLQFSPTAFEGFETILNMPSEPSAGERFVLVNNYFLNLKFISSSTPVNSTPVVNRDLDFEAEPPRNLLSPTLTTPVPLVNCFEIVEGAFIRAKNQFLDVLGNRYGLKRSVPNKDGVFTLLCTRRGRKNEVSCAAYVKQLGNIFTEGTKPHCHEPNPELNLKVPLMKQMKDVALKNLFDSANSLAEDLIVPTTIEGVNEKRAEVKKTLLPIVRTNNDVEGWHRRLNTKAPRKAAHTTREDPTAESKSYKRRNERIKKIWEKYRLEEYTVQEVLK